MVRAMRRPVTRAANAFIPNLTVNWARSRGKDLTPLFIAVPGSLPRPESRLIDFAEALCEIFQMRLATT
jgi:hypothetical protein